MRQLEFFSPRSTLAGCRGAQEDGGQPLRHPGRWIAMETWMGFKPGSRSEQRDDDGQRWKDVKRDLEILNCVFNRLKMAMFDNSHQLSSGVKDIGKRPD